MELKNTTAQIYVPDGLAETEALSRVTHLGIGAHQDDLEFMAFHGILNCFEKTNLWFGGVTCTNGAGSARIGPFASYTDEEMQAVRKKEQNEAAAIGKYAAMIQLDYASSVIKNSSDPRLEADLLRILKATRPSVVYTHNPADKHDTHIAVLAATLRALRRLPPDERPEQVLGCEVWRGLDWMMDDDKVALDVSGNDKLAESLNAVFASQIAGGKRYDLATIGRRRANATFFESHGVDQSNQVCYAMDLTPLIRDDNLNLSDYVSQFVMRFSDDIRTKLEVHAPVPKPEHRTPKP